MPASIKLQEEMGENLQVIFVEAQGATRDKAEAFALQRKWLHTRAMWTNERPVPSPGSGLPSFVLIGADGKVLLQGNPMAMKGQIEDAIAEQISLVKKAPEGTPSKLKKAWSEFGKGNFAKALAAAEKVRASAEEDPELAQAAAEALDTFRERVLGQVARVDKMMESGDFVFAEELLGQLHKSVKGHDELEAEVGEVETRLSSQENADEREAATALFKLEQKMAGKGKLEKHASKLAKLAETHSGTKAAARASRLLTLLEM